MNEHAALARTKSTAVSGGHVNYYLIEVTHPRFGPVVVAEVEDIIEALDMRFAEANVFKAMVRTCKLRMDLGKPGSSRVYELEKAVYYSQRTLAKAELRCVPVNREQQAVADQRAARLAAGGMPTYERTVTIVDVPHPKRLAPYSVDIRDVVEALGATPQEAEVILAIVEISARIRDFAPVTDFERIIGRPTPQVRDIDVAEMAHLTARALLAEGDQRKGERRGGGRS